MQGKGSIAGLCSTQPLCAGAGWSQMQADVQLRNHLNHELDHHFLMKQFKNMEASGRYIVKSTQLRRRNAFSKRPLAASAGAGPPWVVLASDSFGR